MRRYSRWITITVASLLVGLILGSIVAGYLYFTQSTSRFLASGESSFQAGMNAVSHARYDKALFYFHEALLTADNTLKLIEETSIESNTQEQFEKNQIVLGQAYWLKYRAIKSRGFTAVLMENKPLPIFEGQAELSSEQLVQNLSLLRLPVEQLRREALICLREAAYRLPRKIEVLREAVSTEIQLEPMQWNHVHAFATTLSELDPDDERALYLLARLEYEQPIAVKVVSGNATTPLPQFKRSKERIQKSIELVERLKKREAPIRWRTRCLEAQNYVWLMEHYRQPGNMKLEAERSASQILKELLFDENQGILFSASKQDNVTTMSRLDLHGLYSLHQMAIDLTIDESRKASEQQQKMSKNRTWSEQLVRIMDVVSVLANRTKENHRSSEAADFYVQACLKTMPYLAQHFPELWSKYSKQARDLVNTALSENRLGQALPLRLADLIIREGQKLEQLRKYEAARVKYDEALHWLDQGLKNTNESNLPSTSMLALHEAKLRLLIKLHSSRTLCQPHLDILKSSQHDPSITSAAFYEGVLLEREGRLQHARVLLEKAAHSPRYDLSRRALNILIPIYLALEVPEQALAAINDLNRVLMQFNKLSEDERAWALSMLGENEDISLLQFKAHALAANLILKRRKKSLGLPKADLVALTYHENQARQLLEKSGTHPVTQGRMQLAWAEYLLQHDRIKEAEPLVIELNNKHAHWMETLRLTIGYVLQQVPDTNHDAGLPVQPEVVKKIDDIIHQFLNRTQAHPGGKLIWLKWLTTTGRTSLAQQLINDQVFLGNTSTDPAARKLHALVHLYILKPQPSNPILKSIPVDVQVEQALLQNAYALSVSQQVFSTDYQTQMGGLTRAWSAVDAMSRGDHAEASRYFIKCLEFTSIRPLIRHGLIDSLINWADHQPAEVRKLSAEGLQQYPTEMSLHLGYAYASLKMGILGNPEDNSDQVKDMATALKAFAAACQQDHRSPSFASWVETQCWLLSPRKDLALLSALRTLEQDNNHQDAYVVSIKMLLDNHSEADREKALSLAIALRKNRPDYLDGIYWQAQCYEKSGRLNEALACYRELMEKSPQHSGVYPATCQLLLSNSSKESQAACLQVIQRWRAALPDDLQSSLIEYQLYLSQNMHHECRQLMENLLTTLESRANRHDSIQTVSTEKDQEIKLKKAELLTWCGQRLMQMKQYGEATDFLQRAISLCPEYEGAQLQYGLMLADQLSRNSAQGDNRRQMAQQAAGCFAKIYRKNPSHFVAGSHLARILFNELHDPHEAYRILQEIRAPKYNSKPMTGDMLSLDMLITMGQVYGKLDQPEILKERIQLFEEARKRYIEEPQVAYYLAQAYLASGDGKRALAIFLSARDMLTSSTLPTDEQRVLNQQIHQGIIDSQEKSR